MNKYIISAVLSTIVVVTWVVLHKLFGLSYEIMALTYIAYQVTLLVFREE